MIPKLKWLSKYYKQTSLLEFIHNYKNIQINYIPYSKIINLYKNNNLIKRIKNKPNWWSLEPIKGLYNTEDSIYDNPLTSTFIYNGVLNFRHNITNYKSVNITVDNPNYIVTLEDEEESIYKLERNYYYYDDATYIDNFNSGTVTATFEFDNKPTEVYKFDYLNNENYILFTDIDDNLLHGEGYWQSFEINTSTDVNVEKIIKIKKPHGIKLDYTSESLSGAVEVDIADDIITLKLINPENLSYNVINFYPVSDDTYGYYYSALYINVLNIE